NILSFEEDFPNARVVMLEENYRSRSNIIEASSELISHNRERKPKRLWTENPPGGPIKLYEAVDEGDEASYVVEEVLREKGMGRALRDMAVFYRTHSQSRVLEDVLRKREVPYSVYGGIRFYDRKEVKDLLAYLRFLVNPADEVNLFRIVNVPPRGIGAKTLSKLEQIKTSEGLDWMQALERASEGAELGPKSRAGIKRFYDLVKSFSPLLSGPPSPVVAKVIEDSGYKKMLEDEGGPEARSRLENLEELVNAAAEYELAEEGPALSGFLERVSLESDIDRFNPEEGSLTLMTLHSAKGLEFPVVFMVGLEDGVFPHIRSLMDDDDEQGSKIEEERRLCYVGITRAMEQLVISHAGSRIIRGQRQRSEPSQFLSEIPDSFFEKARKGGALKSPRPKRKKQSDKKQDGKKPARVDYGDSELVYEDGGSEGSYEHPDGFTFQAGDAIYHRSYGEGVIKRFEESGERLKIVVKFGSKTKKFLARYAPLEPV
ncbi:MAG: 3'-5' exonuclease, partial [bacterium]